MRTFVTALAAALLGIVLLAGPASAGDLEPCTVTPGSGGAGECLLVIGDGGGVTVTGADLPRTGGDSLPLAQLGVVLVALGGLVVLVARKRADAQG